MAENTIWKVYFFADNKNTQPNRIHGLDPWIQIGSSPDVVRISGNLPRICNQKPICQQLCKVAGH